METNGEENVGLCPICAKEIRKGEGTATCEKCGQVHHVQCFNNAGKCGACDSAKVKEIVAQPVNKESFGTTLINLVLTIGIIYVIYVIFFSTCPEDFSDFRAYDDKYDAIKISDNGRTMQFDLIEGNDEVKEIFNEVLESFDFDDSVTYEKVMRSDIEVTCDCSDSCCTLESHYGGFFASTRVVTFRIK